MSPAHRPAALARTRKSLGIGLFGLAVLSIALPAAAAPLPSGSSFVQCFADGNNSFHATDCTQGGFVGVPPSATASATLSPGPTSLAAVTSPAAAVLGAGADANTHYFFQVTGGNVGDVVPILIDYRLSATATPDATAVAKFIIYTTAMGASFPISDELRCDPQACSETEVFETLSINALSGSVQDSITIYAMAQAPATRISTESATAIADPYIYVDPSFANASLYSIVVSPGFGNVPLPEPAIAWLIGAPLAALVLRKR